MLANGATTVWELWQNKVGPHMNSQNHHMMGSIDAWFYEGWAESTWTLSSPAIDTFALSRR
jgi:hypothetical protein